MGREILFPLRPRHLVDVGEHAVECVKSLQQFASDLGADPGHAGDVVNGIPDERQKVDHLIGPDAPLGRQVGDPEHGVVSQVQQLNLVTEQLPGILVAGGDRARSSRRGDPRCQRGEDVVGLVTGELQAGNAQHVEQPTGERDLGHEVGRHLSPVGLVGLEPLVTKGRPGRVHAAEEIVGPLLLDDVEQVAGEAEDDRHRPAVGGRHLRQRVEELVGPRQ